MLVIFGLVVCLRAEGITLLKPKKPPGATKVLSFPPGQSIGNLYLEPETGPGWDPEHVRLYGEWEYHCTAQGDVLVPEDRNIKLWVQLTLSPRELAKFHAQNPQAHQLTIADRVHKDPDDLSGLLQLYPKDLFWLSVSTAMYQRAGANPQIFEPISHLKDLQILSLHSAGITDEGLEFLRSLRSLRGLELTQVSISNRGLSVLKNLPTLEYLQLNTGVTDEGLRQVAKLSNLCWLSIVDGNIRGPGLAELAKLPRLERLCILQSRSPLFDRYIKYLENLTQLKGLTLWGSGCSTLTDTSLAFIGKLKNLEELYFIRSSPRFTTMGVNHLKELKNLKKMDFAQIWISPKGTLYGDALANQLAANFPNLESIKGISFLSSEGMKELTNLRNLKCLHVTLKDRKQGYYGPTGLSYLTGLSSLEELSISSGDALSEADLAWLEQLGRLKELHIMGRHLTDRSLASISKLKQLESLHLFGSVTRSGLNQLNGLSRLRLLQVTAWRNVAKADPADELMLDLSGLKNMKDIYLGGLPLGDSDLAFLKNLPSLENLSIHSDSSLTGEFLRHLRELPELNRLNISRLSDCTDEDLEHLNGLPKLRSLTLKGDITDTDLASLTGPLSLESLRIETDEPIRKQTVTDLKKNHPVIEYIHINELPKVQTRPVRRPKRTRINQPRTNRRDPVIRQRRRQPIQ